MNKNLVPIKGNKLCQKILSLNEDFSKRFVVYCEWEMVTQTQEQVWADTYNICWRERPHSLTFITVILL